MKHFRLASIILSAATLLPMMSSCSSDPNPFGTFVTAEKETTKIRLLLDPASTRATDDMSTDEEKKISKVNVYVFDDADKLEKFEVNLSVSAESPAELEVTPGKKTIYAISAKSIIDPTIAIGTGISSFEDTVFQSALSDIKTSDGFVMVGKSNPQQVLKSANENELPASNVFNIELVRLLAKTQVKMGNVDVSNFGFKIGGLTNYRVCQTCNSMRLKPNGNDVFSSFENHTDGTFEGYEVGKSVDTKLATTGNFTAENCHYISENIVKNPVSGNTTFVIINFPLIPLNFYSYYGTLSSTPNTSTNCVSFYAVGIVDENNGFEDFAIDPSNKHVIVFNSDKDAQRYADALNGGQTSAITVSESEGAMRAPAAGASDVQVREFQPVLFTGGVVYYRINITDSDGALKVERNKFYKIAVNSIKNLGFHNESLLRPKDPNSDPGHSTSAWVESVLTVADWESVDQPVDL